MKQRKVCIVCEVEKPPGAFYADHRMRDGRLNRCKDCCVAASQQRRTDRKEAVRAVPMRERQVGMLQWGRGFAATEGSARKTTPIP